ncbi:hypothetical protein F5X68DRAFT_210438 [Plectosphaerella plurivora]|uniref:3-hydroxyisobutyrate dehydrogenase n=1 Tax=Plectosphaerella plurivora TaxID=936078 RepID=A0A9P8V8F3_9PEZI|nr:hypothetical protein F5X68DRAFT_210438 [Plectosphaerella plurivora]
MGLIVPTTRVGFIGLGVMGTPMALNLARRFPLTVWNRSESKYPALIKAGAVVANSPAAVVENSDFIFTMLFDGSSLKSILSDDFRRSLRGKTLINTSSVTVGDSESLFRTVTEAGGSFIEMPVSGSRMPAEQGRLVGMMAGDEAACESIRPIVEPLTTSAIYCGPIGSGLRMKYAVNNYLITMTAGLAESMNLAKAQGLDVKDFGEVIDAGPMASAYSRLKIDKMQREDWSAQASIDDCHNSTRLICAATAQAGTKGPLISLCEHLYGTAKDEGFGGEDMVAVIKVLQTDLRRGRT